jgi:hypothetical protein
MKKYIIIPAIAILASGFQACEKEIGHTSDCSSTIALNHPRGDAYQAVLDQYTGNGLPGINMAYGQALLAWQIYRRGFQ